MQALKAIIFLFLFPGLHHFFQTALMDKFLLFSKKLEVQQYLKGKIENKVMIKLSENFLGGGTDFMLPFKKSLEVINESRFKMLILYL